MLPQLIGNSSIKQRISGKISHAYLVAGLEGTGRAVVVRHLVQKALCKNPQETACDQCSSCRKIQNKTHPDLKEYGCEKAISVEMVRELQKELQILPNDSSRSVYVLYRGDEMNQSAQNALLKSLEEPPSHALIIIVTGESGGVLDTIRSRCHCLTLRPVSFEETLHWLRSRYPSIATGLEEVAKNANGSLGRALDIMEPMRKEKKVQESENNPQQEQFHLATKGKSTVGRKVAKKTVTKKEKKTELEDSQLQRIMEQIGENMLHGGELPLFESCVPLEKIGKEQLIEILTGLCSYLSKATLREKRKEYLAYLALTEEILEAVTGNVGGGHMPGWITAGTMEIRKGGLKNGNIS